MSVLAQRHLLTVWGGKVNEEGWVDCHVPTPFSRSPLLPASPPLPPSLLTIATMKNQEKREAAREVITVTMVAPTCTTHTTIPLAHACNLTAALQPLHSNAMQGLRPANDTGAMSSEPLSFRSQPSRHYHSSSTTPLPLPAPLAWPLAPACPGCTRLPLLHPPTSTNSWNHTIHHSKETHALPAQHARHTASGAAADWTVLINALQ